MVKINRNVVIIFFAMAAVAASIHPLVALPSLPYKLFLLYGMIFAAAFFLARDSKIEKNVFTRGVLFTAGAALLGAGQYVFSFFNHHLIGYGVALEIAGIALAAASFLKAGGQETEAGVKTDVKIEAAALAAIAVAAFIMRFWDLAGFLPGVWFDEVQNGAEALKMLESNRLKIFISGNTHMPAMYFYFAALAVKVFGYNIFPLRLVSCVLGTLSVIAFYFLAKQVFKDWRMAVLCAFLLAFSRWHITFSRVAFLGMQAVLFETLFLYFYLKFFEKQGMFSAVMAGALLGLAQYTFTAANFVAIFAALYILFTAFHGPREFFKKYLPGTAIMFIAAVIAAGPLIGYAVKNRAAYFQRASDINIMRDIRDNKGSLAPVFKNLKTYALVFNFEGDYNGRHNLYKKPALDDFSGAFMLIGLAAAFIRPGMRFLPWLFFLMILPGIMTITIESPQMYRIVGVIPALYLIIALGMKEAAGLIYALSRDKKAVVVFLSAAALSAAAVNFHQFFFLYPKHEGTYLSFSPEANGIAQAAADNINDYEVLVTRADKMYGFYAWEQAVIIDFAFHGKRKPRMLYGDNQISPASIEGKKGVLVITRPSDKEIIDALQTVYAGRIAKKDVYTNPFNGNEIYSCWFIDKDKLFTTPGSFIYVK